MGKRRIRLIQQIDSSIDLVGVDSNQQRCNEAKERFSIETLNNIDEINDAQCAFVCTSPLSHSKIINACLKKGLNVFTELNLVDDMYDENIQLADEKGVVLFLSSTFLYREEIEYMSKRVKECGCNVHYCYHIGQYLPDWHPWENYKNFFVNDRRSNGCREIMAIELPWLTKAFGKVTDFYKISNKMTDLDIDYDDNYMIMLEHESGARGSLLVDVVSRKAVRNLEIFGEKIYLSWNGSPTGLFEYDYDEKISKNIALYRHIDQLEGYSAFVIENIYKKEIEAFFHQVKTGLPAIYDFNDDKEILKLIDRIEGVSQNEV